MTKFTETQTFSAIAYVVLGLSSVAAVYAVAVNPARSGAGLLWLFLPLGLTFNLLCQRTVVSDADLTVTFGALLPLYRRQFPLPKIAVAEAVTYSPLTDYGGWGIRGWGRNVALNARGNRGVRIVLQDGSRVLVGSQRPEELAQALGALG